jgi:alpha-glucosidase (family GH31 glycosyl hydrolase)
MGRAFGRTLFLGFFFAGIAALALGACGDSAKSDAPQSGVTPVSPAVEAGTASEASVPVDAKVVDSPAATVDAESGAPVVPWPEWAFHHWVWEDESTQQSALDLIADYKSHGIPVGAIIIDSPWETGYNTFDWDTNRFPNPKQMVDAIHADSVRVLLWIVPAINLDVPTLYDQAKSQNFFLEQVPFSGPGVVDWWKGKGSLIDYFNPSALGWWRQRVDKALDLGIDGWKCDGLDFSVTSAPFSRGKPGLVTHADYANAYYRDFFDYTRSKLGNDRLITARPVDTYGYDVGVLGSPGLTQATFAPRDINWVGWVGDQDPTFDGLKNALLNMYYSAQLGYLGFGSDIGGYRDLDDVPLGRTKEVFIRWAQLGAFSPLMENGGSGEHRPWMFDNETTDIYRTFVKLHYALIPYMMSEGAKAWAQKKSLVTYLDKADYRFLLGPDVFVAPMLEAGTTRAVTFPAGSDWIYLFDKSKTYTGGSTATLTVPYAEFPVFLKKGSTLATDLTVVP